jgi:hypothetical protein
LCLVNIDLEHGDLEMVSSMVAIRYASKLSELFVGLVAAWRETEQYVVVGGGVSID